MNRPELHTDFKRGFLVETSLSNDPSMLHIRTFNGQPGYRIVEKLISESQAETGLPESQQAPFEFAGRHAGMAQGDVWAVTRNGQDITPYLPAVITCLNAFFDDPAPRIASAA